MLLKATVGGTEKKFVGTTSNSFGINAETKDSITKDDMGVKSTVFTGYSWEAGVDGLIGIKSTGDTEHIDRNDLIGLVKAGTIIDVVYGPISAGSKVQTGKAIIASFSESTDSENEGTYSVSLKGTSALTDSTLP